jgi:hypothetical protein
MGKCHSKPKSRNEYINDCIKYLFQAEYMIQICSMPQDVEQICKNYINFQKLKIMDKFAKSNHIIWKNAGVKSAKDINQIYLMLTLLYVDLTTIYILAKGRPSPITEQMMPARVAELQINATKSYEDIGTYICNIKRDISS